MFGASGGRAWNSGIVLALCGLVLAPPAARAADHRDSPLVKTLGALDINDVYAFQSPTNSKNSVLVATVVPLAGVFNVPVFSSTGTYEIFRVYSGVHSC